MPSYNKNLEDPLDLYIFRKIANILVDPLHKMGLSPSNITTISLFFSFLSPVFYLYNHLIIAVIFYFIYYVLDCVDGQVARKYNECSFFGAVYDWNKDHIVGFLFLLTFFLKSDYYAFFSILLFIFPMLLHIGTLDAVSNFEKTNSFKSKSVENQKNGLFYRYYFFSKNICYYSFYYFFYKIENKKIFKSIELIKYFGTGTFTILIFLSILGLQKLSFFISFIIITICFIINVINNLTKKK